MHQFVKNRKRKTPSGPTIRQFYKGLGDEEPTDSESYSTLVQRSFETMVPVNKQKILKTLKKRKTSRTEAIPTCWLSTNDSKELTISEIISEKGAITQPTDWNLFKINKDIDALWDTRRELVLDDLDSEKDFDVFSASEVSPTLPGQSRGFTRSLAGSLVKPPPGCYGFCILSHFCDY